MQATKYVITTPDRNVFLGTGTDGKFDKVSSKEEATIFRSESRAKNVLANSLKVREMERWVCIPYSAATVSPDIEENIADSLNILNELQERMNIEIQKLLQQKEHYVGQESLVDREISDIYHFVAFEKVSVTKWSKIYKLLSAKLQERANIKHQMRILDSVILGIRQGKQVSEVINTASKETDKDYVPRTYIYEMLKEL